jgi:hypothetical protein
MATPEKFTGSNVAEILAMLTTAMKIPNSIGNAEAARNASAPRVTWVPVPKGGRSYSQTSQQRGEFKHIHEVAIKFQVHLYGRDYFACEELEILLERALYNTLSRNAYELLADGEESGDQSPTVNGYEFIVPVRLLRIPLPVEIRKTITLMSASASGSVESIDGTGTTPTGTITAP